MAPYMNDRGAARFQRSQSQNDLDRQTHDDKFYNPREMRSSASGYNIQRPDSQHDRDQKVRRHPSDIGDRYRRSYDEWNGTRMPPSAVVGGDLSQTDALENRPLVDQKLRSPSDPSRPLESSRHGDRTDPEHRGGYEVQRLHGTSDEVQRSYEKSSDVPAVSKKPSMSTENPKNQDIINWLKRGDSTDHEPRDADYIPDGRDMNRSASSYNHPANDRTTDGLGNRSGYGAGYGHAALSASKSYPATRSDSEFVSGGRMGRQTSPTSGQRADKEEVVFPQYGVSNPTYDAGLRASASDRTHSSDGSTRVRDAVGQHQGYNRPDARVLQTFSNGSRQPSTDHPDSNQGFPSHIRGLGFASAGYQPSVSSQIPPPKPVHTFFTNSPSTHGMDQSDDLPPSLPPKLANQQVSVKPSHISPSQLDQYRRPADAVPRSATADHLQVMKDRQADSTSEYAIVQKRPVQSLMSDWAADGHSWRDDVKEPVRPRADGAGYPSDIASRSRQSPDGTLDSPDLPASKSNIQPLAVSVTSSSDFGNERRPGVKSSSQENLTAVPPVRPPLPSDSVLAVSGVLENLSVPTRSEPQGGAEHTDLQVNILV